MPVTTLSASSSALLVLAGCGAGFVNGVAGGGSLISFPALLAVGYSPLTANVTSTIGIWPGYLGGVAGYRSVLTGQRDRIRQLAPTAMVGALGGTALLLTLPAESFAAAAPWLILIGCLLFAVQPLVGRAARSRDTGPDQATGPGIWLHAGVLLAAGYGSYFGAGLGVILLGVLGLRLPDRLVRVNGLRAVLALLINTVAWLVYAVTAPVAWPAAGLLAGASLVGGWLGATVSRRIPGLALRLLVIGLGLVSALALLLG